MWSPRTVNNGTDLRAATRGRPYVTSIFSQFLSYGRLTLPQRTWKLRSSQAARKTVYVHVHVNVHVDVDVIVDVNGSGNAIIPSRQPDTPHN